LKKAHIHKILVHLSLAVGGECFKSCGYEFVYQQYVSTSQYMPYGELTYLSEYGQLQRDIFCEQSFKDISAELAAVGVPSKYIVDEVICPKNNFITDVKVDDVDIFDVDIFCREEEGLDSDNDDPPY